MGTFTGKALLKTRMKTALLFVCICFALAAAAPEDKESRGCRRRMRVLKQKEAVYEKIGDSLEHMSSLSEEDKEMLQELFDEFDQEKGRPEGNVTRNKRSCGCSASCRRGSCSCPECGCTCKCDGLLRRAKCRNSEHVTVLDLL